MNNVQLLGRLTQDVTLYEGNKNVAKFSLALNHNKEEVSFINCVAFDKTADLIAGNFAKGDMICIEGYLKQEKYNGKSHVNVVVNRMHFLGNKSTQEKKQTNEYVSHDFFKGQQPKETRDKEEIDFDSMGFDLPF